MSQYDDSGYKPFDCGEAIAMHSRVKLGANDKIVTAGLADKGVGVATRDAFTDGEPLSVKLNSAAGTAKMIASGSIAAGGPVYSAEDGKIQGTAAETSYQVGVAMEAATADGDIIEVMPQIGDTAAS